MYNSASGGYGSGLSFSSYTSTSGATGEVTAARIRTSGEAAWNSAANNTSSLIFSTINENTLSDKMWLRGNGWLGIGLSPSYPLHVKSSLAGNWFAQIENEASDGYCLMVKSAATGGQILLGVYSGSNSRLQVMANGQVGIGMAPVRALHVKDPVNASSYIRSDCTGSTSDSGFEIYQNGSRKWEIVNDHSESSPLTFRNADGAQKIIFNQAGKIGIGIGANVPGAYLEIKEDGGGGDVAAILLQNSASGSQGSTVSINFKHVGQNAAMIRVGKHGNYLGSTTRTGSLQFWVSSSGAGALQECMRMVFPDDNTSPFIGMGTTSPQALLDVTVYNAKTASIGTYMYLGKTNESSNYAALQCGQTGASGQNTRRWEFQTIEQGVSNEGIITMQRHGGEVCIGGTSNANKLSVVGSFSKSSGSFRIPHPLPSLTATKDLVHSFIEGPQADLIYRGKVDLSSGTATVNIDTAAGMTDGTFILLCDDVQCFTTNEDNWDLVKASVSGNILTITSQNSSSTASNGFGRIY